MTEGCKKFNGLAVSSKFAICGLPIRLDSYKTCNFGCKYCFSNARKIMEFKKELQVCDVDSVERRLHRVLFEGNVKDDSFLDNLIRYGVTWHCGGMADPFQQVNEELRITNKLIDVTSAYKVKILFSTKGDSVHGSSIDPTLHTFQLSVTNVDDRRDIEPGVPSIQSRLRFFKELKGEGFKVGIRIQPFIPNVSTLDIVRMFEGADHFTLEGLKVVPQNEAQKRWVFSHLGLGEDDFVNLGLLNLDADIRRRMYEPFVQYFNANNISYSVSDNDMRRLGNNDCCCGDSLVCNPTTFNTTAMLRKYGTMYGTEELKREISDSGLGQCRCDHLFTSNRTKGMVSVMDTIVRRFGLERCTWNPSFQRSPRITNKLF